MYLLSTREEIEAAPGLTVPEAARAPLAAAARHTLDHGLGNATYIVVALASDAEPALAREIGGSLLADGPRRFGDPGFAAAVDGAWALPGGWTQLTVCVGDSGFAYVLLVEPRSDELGRLCRALAR